MRSTSRLSPAEELAEFLARRPTVAEIEAFRLSETTLKRARELLEKNQDSGLTEEESRELDKLIWLDDLIGLIQIRAAVPTTNGTSTAGGTRDPQQP